MSTKYMNNFAAGSLWLGRASVLALLVVSLAACEERENPDTVVVSPVPSVPASPSPNVVVVSPTITIPASPPPNVVTTTAPIVDVVEVATAPDKQALVNRQVQLTNTPVQSLVSDRTFWVGSNNQRLLAVLDEALNSGAAEQRVDINPGQTLSINGFIRRLPPVAEAQEQWGLSAAEAEALENQQVYLQVSKVQQK